MSSTQSLIACDSFATGAFASQYPFCTQMDDGQIDCAFYVYEDLPPSFYRFSGDGRSLNRKLLAALWTKEDLPSLKLHLPKEAKIGLKLQQHYLRNEKSHAKLRAAAKTLQRNFSHTDEIALPKGLTAYRLSGADKKGNVQFTGYFTPIIHVRKKADAHYRFPLYRKPAELKQGVPFLSRKEIEQDGALRGRGLEIAFTNHPLDIFFMQVQGSGLAVFEDGSSRILAYAGKNGHPYVSIGRLLVEDGHLTPAEVSLEAIQDWFDCNPSLLDHYLLQNPSYVFFTPKGQKPMGASGMPLVAQHSVAVDPTIIPYGSVLLARVPVLDSAGKVDHHDWRLLFAQDTGSAIKGPGHIDLYMGTGAQAKKLASNLHHYGEIWLLTSEHRGK